MAIVVSAEAVMDVQVIVFVSSIGRETRCALVTVGQTDALPISLQADQPEWNQLAVVGHADRRFQQCVQDRLVGRRRAELARGDGTALLQQGDRKSTRLNSSH